jgi:hypothetical protein
MIQAQNSNSNTNIPALEVESGITSIFLDTEALSSLTGYNLAGTSGTVAPATDEFQVGFNINEESDFSFTTENGFTPTGGSIEQDGTITFNTVNGPSTVGDFSIAFDASRVSEERSGFFVQSGFFTTDTIEPGQILFDISTPEILNITDSTLNIDEADLLISAEFSSFLQTQGFSSTDLTGTDVGDTRIDAIIGFAEYDCNSGDLM